MNHHPKLSNFDEIVSHFRLFTMEKKNIVEYFSSPYRVILISIFTILFFPHVFVVVKDINFVVAYEVDPGSIIESILSLFQNSYNMNASYHSQYYGWTYFSINYFLLMPVYLAKVLKIVTDDYYFFVAIRFIFFMIGLGSVLAFFDVAKQTLKQNFFSFLAAILYIASPAVFKFFYFIHPETTGLLFLFISILCAIHYNEGAADDYRWYTFGLISLVLSVLSKQVFLFIAPAVIFIYIYMYCHHHKKSIFRFLFSKQFTKALLASIVLSILIFFVINPFAFIQPKEFIGNQIVLFSGNTESIVSTREAMETWLQVIKTMPIMFISIILFPFTVLGAVTLGHAQNIGKVFYIVNILASVLFVIIISISLRFLYSAQYFAPIYPFFILNLISIPLYILRRWNVNILKWLVMIPTAYFLFFVLVTDFSFSIPANYARLMYKETAIYQVYRYIQEEIPDGSKIAHDHLVTFPSTEGLVGCQYWQECGTDYIEVFQPDYVIFSETWKFNGEMLPGTLRLKKYVRDHHFLLINTISYGGNDQISVWKNPDQ